VDFARTDEDLRTKMTAEALKEYDGVVFANTTGDLPLPDKDAFIDWVESGKAFIGMHSCSDTFHGYPRFIKMLGGEFLTHHSQVTIKCFNQDRRHPANRGFGAFYEVHDEIYLFKNFHRDQVHGLLSLDQHPNDLTPGDYPISWCKMAGQGRVFYTELGHREDVWTSAPYQSHILGGIRWALGLARGSGEPQDLSAHVSRAEEEEGFHPLFDGVDLNGWKLRHADGRQSWSVQNGMLVNTVTKESHGTDLVSTEQFKDFEVRYEYLIPPGGNSGFYLRGRKEIQILGDYDTGKAATTGNGSIYNFKAPDQFVTRPPGCWQEVEAIVHGNRVTVWLNGVKIHDNVEVPNGTGGQLDDNNGTPGPILLQGDHGSVAFRNIRIKQF
jgi:type 1 glutamine amidotransferase